MPYLTVKIRKTWFLDRYFIFSGKTGILPKCASRGAFRGSERPKISIFPNFSEITRKTVVRGFFPKIYVFLIEKNRKRPYRCRKWPWLPWSKYVFLPWIVTSGCITCRFRGLKISIFPKFSEVPPKSVLSSFFHKISVSDTWKTKKHQLGGQNDRWSGR